MSNLDDEAPNLVMMGQWAFGIDNQMPLDQRFLAAPCNQETGDVAYHSRHPIDAFNVSKADMQILFRALDLIYGVANEDGTDQGPSGS